MSDWDAIFGEAALGLDLAKVDPRSEAGPPASARGRRPAQRPRAGGSGPSPTAPA